MKFAIHRTSDYRGSTPPCKEAIHISSMRVDERTTDDPKKLPCPVGDYEAKWWYETGTNHRVENGHIKRDFEEWTWLIEIASLEALAAFCDEYGCLIISSSGGNMPELEIYDDYRE